MLALPTAYAGPSLPSSFAESARISVSAGTSAFDLVLGRIASVERLIFRNSFVTGTLAAIFDPDPYFALRLDVTNSGSDALAISVHMFSPLTPVIAPAPPTPPFPTFQAQFDLELFDADGDGSAHYGGGGLHFFLADRAAGSGLQITPRFGIDTDEIGTGGIAPFGPAPVPPSVTGQYDTMEMFHTGFNRLSAGDRVVLEGFGCVALPGAVCPSPPDLAAAIPELSSVWMFLAGLATLGGLRKARRLTRAA